MQKRHELNYLPEDKRDEETDGKVRELSEKSIMNWNYFENWI